MKNKNELTQERLKEVLNYNPETGVFTWKINKGSRTSIDSVAGCFGVKQNGILIRINKILYSAHYLAYLYMTGYFPTQRIKHIDGNKNNNRWSNLDLKKRGWTTAQGYRAFIENGERILEHRIIVEKAGINIPEGYYIHHKDGNKINNSFTNLEIVSPLYHNRIHKGAFRENGMWLKTCPQCQKTKEISEDFWRFDTKGHVTGGMCELCCKNYHVEWQRKRRDLNRQRFGRATIAPGRI